MPWERASVIHRPATLVLDVGEIYEMEERKATVWEGGLSKFTWRIGSWSGVERTAEYGGR